jgi:organic radical activating enzyme
MIKIFNGILLLFRSIIHGKTVLSDDYYKMRCILICFEMYEPLALEVSDLYKKLETLGKEHQLESEKEYSERKFQIIDEVQEVATSYHQKSKEVIDSMYLKYYEIIGNDILTDIEETLIYLTNMSKFRDYTQMITMFEQFKKIFQNSQMNHDMTNFSEFIK